MIPSVIASQVERGIEDFLRTTFPPSNPFFHGILDRLFEERKRLFKGPYVSVKLPFRQGTLDRDYFDSFKMSHPPYLHQEKAFTRLSADTAKSTIISTGTGSGKTECFLYPILDYCYQHRGEPGIKAIIIYPMNALANDQAKRMASLIASGENLKGNVTAGLFVGQDPAGKGQMTMTQDMVITHKDTMRTSPPDILLTNYKMLDYLLIRPGDFRLWKDNAPETLRFLVVDELHTFDGAQGTDLACLIRRLKARVKAPSGYVCCVGTSATLGGEEDAIELRDYAKDIFNEDFDAESVVTEDRYTATEFLGDTPITRHDIIDKSYIDDLLPDNFTDWQSFISRQYELWFGQKAADPSRAKWVVTLSDELRQHSFFRSLILILNNQTFTIEQIAESLQKIDASLLDADHVFLSALIDSMLALISVARRQSSEANDKLLPFLDVRIQVWMRELRRVVSEVAPDAHIRFSDDLKPEQLQNHLPLVHCRECGAMGWAAVKRQQDSEFASDLQKFYQAYFNYSPNIHFIFPSLQSKDPQLEFPAYICGHCLHMGDGEPPEVCPACGLKDKIVASHIVNKRVKRKSRSFGSHDCPYCESHDSMTIVGSRSASLLSVVIGQLYNSTYYNDQDRKLLAFSDSVQDASHRAGFFEARTFRFNFRTALQQVIAGLDEPVSLEDLPKKFTEYWRKRLPEPYYIATFLAPDMEWHEDYEKLKTTGRIPEDSELLRWIEERIQWEISSEYCFRSRIGRTLEKTSCSIAHPSLSLITLASAKISEQLQNEIGGWQSLETAVVTSFLLGLLIRLKTLGAVDTGALNTYIESWGSIFVLNKVPFLPKFGKRAPIFLTTKRGGTRFDALLASGTNESWYQNWLRRSMEVANPRIGEYADSVYRVVLKTLVDCGILAHYDRSGHTIWCLRPDALQVERDVDQHRCNHCSFVISAPKSERLFWEDMPCRRFRCPGRYELQAPVLDYYGRLYSSGEVNRIFAGEHTGLLKREDRELLESRFIKQDMPASENLLSCTPTLEMGINIGDLSTVLLCSVPPSQANYLQRIGRSGRHDGNAFNFAMAEGKPHDLYFFEEPQDMLGGAVEPPGVFLNAPAVLERQFVGYGFDRWSESSISITDLPRKVGQVLNNLAKNKRSGLFPYNWLDFIDTRRTELLNSFQRLFENTLNDASRERLKAFVEGDADKEESLIYKVLNRLNGLKKERDSLRSRVQQINRTIKTKESSKAKDQNTEGEILELKRDKASLNGIIHSINEKDTFNFFTDEGLLPNYAFPEAGILLRSIIYRKRNVTDQYGKYDTRVYEYQRPAATAIHELAPANMFYADGRKVTIDRINIELSQPEDWRFCNACSYAIRETLNTHKSSCPRCGSLIWADAGQKRSMLRLHQVEATTSDRESRVDDTNDSREPQFYNKHMLVDAKPQFIEKAFRIDSDDVPFGFEFLRKVDFKEINFGSQTGLGETIDIAGKSVPVDGFMVCKACGKVRDPEQDEEFRHALTCRYHGKSTDKPFLDYLYLYRQFSSEAIRILLPVTSCGMPVKLHSFVAALYLGLEKMFKGSIDHLATTVVEEPVEGSAIKKQFLVLYDRIPGGTGYLKELSQTENSMMELISQALEALKDCRCQNDPEKDGCYRCLYAYRVSKDMAEISRREAISLLTDIVACRNRLIAIDTVSNIPINSLLDSELEARFVEALRRSCPAGKPAVLTNEVVNGKPGWHLKLDKTVWTIEPQVSIGNSEGVTIPSIADFVFYPTKRNLSLPIAVFTDGFQYHADVSAGNLRVGEDLSQRMAIVRSGKFLTWSLSWQDVEHQFGSNNRDYFNNYLDHSPATLTRLLDAYDKDYRTNSCSGFSKLNSFEALVTYLDRPDMVLWRFYAFLQAINGKRNSLGYGKENWINSSLYALESSRHWNEIEIPKCPSSSMDDWYASILVECDAIDRPAIIMLAAMPSENVKNPNETHLLKVTARLFDDADIASSTEAFRASWNGFLRLFNFMQFLPQVKFITTGGISRSRYDGLQEPVFHDHLSLRRTNGDSRLELLSLTNSRLHTVINAIYKSHRVAPEPGYELSGVNGEVVAVAELAWPDLRIAILLPEQAHFTNSFETNGWIVHLLHDLTEDIGSLIEGLPSGVED